MVCSGKRPCGRSNLLHSRGPSLANCASLLRLHTSSFQVRVQPVLLCDMPLKWTFQHFEHHSMRNDAPTLNGPVIMQGLPSASSTSCSYYGGYCRSSCFHSPCLRTARCELILSLLSNRASQSCWRLAGILPIAMAAPFFAACPFSIPAEWL